MVSQELCEKSVWPSWMRGERRSPLKSAKHTSHHGKGEDEVPDQSDTINRETIEFVDATKFETLKGGRFIDSAIEDEYALLFSVNGDVTVVECDMQVGKQQAFLTKLQQPIHITDQNPGHTIIHIRFKWAKEILDGRDVEQSQRLLILKEDRPVVIPSAGNVYRLLIEILYECFRQCPGYKKICAHMLEIVLSRLLCSQETNENQGLRNYAEEVRNYIEHHYMENISLHDMARYFWVSVSHLQNQFKDRYGMTIIAWLNKYRYMKAITLMENEHVPMSKALFQSGISGRQQYYRLKKMWGNGTTDDKEGGIT